MPQTDIRTKAKMLLQRRSIPNSPWYYFYADLRRQVIFLILSVAMPLLVWYLGLKTLALALGCFIMGAKLRDVRWWFALTALWPDTEKFLDWDKIESIANGESEF